MRTLLLLLFTLLAGSAAAQDSAPSVSCKYDDADCRDGCTIDYGGSSRNYDKLGACLKKCKREYDRCLERQFSLEKEKLEKEKLEKEKLEKEKLKEQAETMSADGGAPGADGGPTDTDGGTKGSDGGPSKPSKPGTKASESKQPEFEDTSELDQLYDEQQSPDPPPKSKK